MYDETNQIGLPGSDQFWKQQLNESGLEMHWITAAIAGVAAVAGAVGGYQDKQAKQDAANKQAGYNKEMWEFNWEETQRREDYAQYELDLAKLNNENLRDLTNQMSLDKYNRDLYIRDYNYKSQVERYNASEGQYAKQLDYNAMGAELARMEQDLWMEDQQKLLQFQYADIAMDKGRARDKFDLTRKDIDLQQISKRGEFAVKSLEGWLKGLDAAAKVNVIGQSGRTRKKNLQSVAMATGMQQAFLNDIVTKSDEAFKLKQVSNFHEYVYARRQAQLDEEKTASSWDSAVKANELAHLRISHDQYGADMSADSRRLAPPRAYSDLPPIPAPYEVPETHFADIFRSSKPPGPVGAPNLMAGAGLTAFAQAGAGIAKAVSGFNANTSNHSGGGGSMSGMGSYSNYDGMGGQNPFSPGGTSTFP